MHYRVSFTVSTYKFKKELLTLDCLPRYFCGGERRIEGEKRGDTQTAEENFAEIQPSIDSIEVAFKKTKLYTVLKTLFFFHA